MGKVAKVMTEALIKENLVPKQMKKAGQQSGFVPARSTKPNTPGRGSTSSKVAGTDLKRIPSDVPTAMIAPTDYKNFYFHKKHGRDFQEAKRVPSDAPTCLREAGEFRKMFLGDEPEKPANAGSTAGDTKIAVVKSVRVSTVTSQQINTSPATQTPTTNTTAKEGENNKAATEKKFGCCCKIV